MAALQSDAFVFFGATGDLAYKKVFPALQYLVKRGRLTVPIIGVAKAGWTLDDLKTRARDSLEKHGGVDETAFDALVRSVEICRWRLQRSCDVRETARGARPGQTSGPLPGHSADPVSSGGRAVGPVGLCQGSPGDPRKALRPRSRVGPRAERDAAELFRRVFDFPHRPLPGQRAGAEPALFPLFQYVLGADLEPQLRREHPDHDGRKFWSARARCLLRRGRHDPRRGAKPPACKSSAC